MTEHQSFRAALPGEPFEVYEAARANFELFERVAQLEASNAALLGTNIQLIEMLAEMWRRTAQVERERGAGFSADQWEMYAARAALLLFGNAPTKG